MASHHFPGSLEKIYIMNPSMGLKLSWRIISAFIDEKSLRKISFTKKSDFPSLKEYFDPETLEITYGGTLPKPTEFWPPPSTIHGSKGYSNQSIN